MAGAYRITTHCLENLKLALDPAAMHRRTQAAQVMMKADALDLFALTVE